jgi:peroxiredoxin
MKILKFFSAATFVLAAIALTSCNNRKFHVNGNITDAKDSMLYLENISLNGPVKIDSVQLGEDGAFAFDENALDTITPEFYRLRIANQTINLSVDSTETLHIKAAYPSMSYNYEVEGSEDCARIKELSVKQMNLQAQLNNVAKNPSLGADSMQLVVATLVNNYKQDLKLNYIFKQPMKASSYYALFQTIQWGNANSLIFNPRNNKEDIKVFAAVATSWDTYYPGAERGKNLHNIAIQGMKDVRIIENQMAEQQIDASKVNVNGCIDLALQDNKGQVRHLTDLKGRVVMLDFHVFAGEQSTKRIMSLRELYNKYHAAGFEIYQVSVDSDEHFWKTSTAAIPWVCVRDENGAQGQSVAAYNVQSVPTYYIIDKTGTLRFRDVQVKDLDATLKSLLAE